MLVAVPPDQSTLVRLFRAGDISQVSRLADSLPDSSSDRLFFDALVESDASLAVAGYSEFLQKQTDSPWAPYALERLSAWEATKGNSERARALMGRLQTEYPGFTPNFDLQAQLNDAPPVFSKFEPLQRGAPDGRKWSVQVGAYRNRKSAESVGKKAGAFGKVSIQEKKGSSGVINVVKVGVFNTKEEAESVASKIMKKTDLNAVVVVTVQ